MSATPGDDGPRAWLDGLSQRALSLFYQAWARYRIECQGDADGGDFLPLQLALAGMAPDALEPAPDALPAHVLAHYAALLRQRPATAEVMQAVLADYFGVPVQLQRFIRAWVIRAPHEHTRLAGSNAVLGGGAMLGERCRRADLRLRLVLGPLSREQYDDFLPGQSGRCCPAPDAGAVRLAVRQLRGAAGAAPRRRARLHPERGGWRLPGPACLSCWASRRRSTATTCITSCVLMVPPEIANLDLMEGHAVDSDNDFAQWMALEKNLDCGQPAAAAAPGLCARHQ